MVTLQLLNDDDDFKTYAILNNGNHVGELDIMGNGEEIEVSNIVITEKRKGFGTKAIELLKRNPTIHIINGTCYEDNPEGISFWKSQGANFERNDFTIVM